MVYPPPPPLSKSGLKLVCNENIELRNLKSEKSHDYAQKPEIVRSRIRLLALFFFLKVLSHIKAYVQTMDQISIKTLNPKRPLFLKIDQ